VWTPKAPKPKFGRCCASLASASLLTRRWATDS
jgi:hypothetical protein